MHRQNGRFCTGTCVGGGVSRGAVVSQPHPRSTRAGREHDREILRLAVPAFLALVAEPMFLLADTAIVGHLGTPELAALGVASAVMGTLVSLCVFLAYGTTASVARQVGAGPHPRGARPRGSTGCGWPPSRRWSSPRSTVPLTRPLVAALRPRAAGGGPGRRPTSGSPSWAPCRCC